MDLPLKNLLTNRLARALASSRVSLGSPYEVADPYGVRTVATEVKQTLDIHRHFTKGHLRRSSQTPSHATCRVPLPQLTNLGAFGNVSFLAQTLSLSQTNAIDVRQRDHCVLVVWNVYTGNTCHYQSPFVLARLDAYCPYDNELLNPLAS